MEKQLQYFGKTASGTFCHPVFGSAGVFEKTAGAPAFAEWDNGDVLRKYIGSISKAEREKSAFVLVNALGAGEYFGSNINADYFPWDVLTHEGEDYGYKTFLNAHAFQHHVNKDPSRAFGQPVLSLLNPRMKRVELLIRLDREKARIEGADGVIHRIDAGEFPDVSMGCKVPYDVCYVCRHKSKTKDDYCVHMKPPDDLRHLYGPNKILPNGMKCCVLNFFARFFDISFVFIGADKTAKVMAKLASKGRQVCLGDVCSLPSLSADVADKLVRDESGSLHTIGEVAKDYAARIRASIAPYEKTASAEGCECGCSEGCEDFDKLAFALTGKQQKTAAQLKVGEIIKTIPAGGSAMKSLSGLESSEPNISKALLNQVAEKHDVGTACSTAGMLGIVLKPREFQRIVLIRMGEKNLADDLDANNSVFRPSQNFDDSVSVDKDLLSVELMRVLSGLMSSRSGLGAPLRDRVIGLSTSSKKVLPTDSPVDHPLLNKMGAAYNGYRRNLLQKLSQAEEVIQNDPQLRDTVIGNSLVNMFMKTASSPIVSLDSISYFAGAHLQNRDLLFNTPVDAGVGSQFTDQA